jgi:hypothetical protein
MHNLERNSGCYYATCWEGKAFAELKGGIGFIPAITGLAGASPSLCYAGTASTTFLRFALDDRSPIS